MNILRSDLYRLFHSKRLFFILILYIIAIFLCNYNNLFILNEFLSIDSLIDIVTESGWFREVLYLISALPFALSYCEDYSHGYLSNIIARGTITAYARSKVIVTIFSTFFISLLGFFFTILILMPRFPLYDTITAVYPNISGGYGSLVRSDYPYTFFFIRILLFASGSALWAVISLYVSSYKPDFFLTSVMPFIASYTIYRLCMNLPDFLNVDFCISGYAVIVNVNILHNFLYAMGYIWLIILIIGISFIRKLERSMQ